MPISADLLLDTSASLALLHDTNPAHEEVLAITHGLTRGLAGHALFETYSVMTRLPGEARVDRGLARQLIARAFPASVALPPDIALDAVTMLSEAGIAGGAVYDGLVGLAARAAGIPLLSCDRRAMPTYAALGVDVRLV
ncbi:PIN domain-containing protein [Microbacterium sp. ASV81]|uniref:Ribonuclease VapC n=1 Tax=Microbacterium capsulatum TaxID=3041921 RepID=A0ABU0XLR9_9MICO|nr:PIN domain-containing protein [Microbacterium sp. ASV81]MDQ4215782.1 PIN domain-containing protein [Microbacterium sp. ASV81]